MVGRWLESKKLTLYDKGGGVSDTLKMDDVIYEQPLIPDQKIRRTEISNLLSH